MSYSVDANILLYASDTSSPRQPAASRFLEQRGADPDLFCLAWPTLMSFLRISTHPRIFARPLSPGEAFDNVKSLLTLPRVRVLAEDDGSLHIYGEVTVSLAARGNQVSDAHLAALLRQHGVRRLYTVDRDFRRFDFLETVDPFA